MRLPTPAVKIVNYITHALGFQIQPFPATVPGIDPEMADTIARVRPYTMTSVERLVALCDAIRYLARNGIAGDIVECGVWRGGSMMAAARTLLQGGDTARHLYLFDTFEGMTEPGEIDVSFEGNTAAELLRSGSRTDPSPESIWCYAPLGDVETAMRGTGYEPAKIHLVKGRVQDTVPTRAPERIALLRLDTDWYESTYHELVHLYPRLVPGGVLIVDDYGHWQGARRAVDQYMAEHRIPLCLHRIDYSGRSAVKWKP